MSNRERRNRKDEAEAALARFGEFMALMTERARLRVVMPVLLADPDPVWRSRVAGKLGVSDPDDEAGLQAALGAYVAGLAARSAAYRGDPAVEALIDAELALSGALNSTD